jgi:hypothetical protein
MPFKNNFLVVLQSIGRSGMTIMEELIEAALNICSNSRKAGQRAHSRGAVLLTEKGMYEYLSSS